MGQTLKGDVAVADVAILVGRPGGRPSLRSRMSSQTIHSVNPPAAKAEAVDSDLTDDEDGLALSLFRLALCR